MVPRDRTWHQREEVNMTVDSPQNRTRHQREEADETVLFNDIEVGTEYVSAPRTIAQSDIQRFAELSGDFNPLHVDPQWVRANTDFTDCIAHGLLMLAVGNALKTEGLDDWQIKAYLGVNRRMIAPAYPGDTVRMHTVVTEVRPSQSRPDTGIVTVEVTLVNQDSVVLQAGTDTYLVGAQS